MIPITSLLRLASMFRSVELNEMYEMIEELPDYIVECLDEFISHYGTLEEVVEHKRRYLLLSGL